MILQQKTHTENERKQEMGKESGVPYLKVKSQPKLTLNWQRNRRRVGKRSEIVENESLDHKLYNYASRGIFINWIEWIALSKISQPEQAK